METTEQELELKYMGLATDYLVVGMCREICLQDREPGHCRGVYGPD